MTRIKICGIKTLPDALDAIVAGADLLGFNFYPKSPRHIAPKACAEITSILREKHPAVTLVGVFVNSPADAIRATLETAHLHMAQLHGDETPEMLAELGPQIAFKAFRGVPDEISGYPRSASPALLVDAAVKGVYGGSGVTADWSAASQLAKQIPLLLAGGLTPKNVADAITRVQPWGVDTASGVESAPGVKDPVKMQAFAKAVFDTR
jgi:phosphoribosylanthranilate isomerase